MDLAAQYARFRAAHPLQTCDIGGLRWEFITGGAGGEWVVLLPGAFASAHSSFQYADALEPHFRVLCVQYPPQAATVAALVAGIAGVLDAAGTARAHMVGGSFSGMIAQCFMRAHPGRLGRLVLSHAGVPWPPRARSFELYLRSAALHPHQAMRLFARMGNHASLRGDDAATAFWRAHFDELIDTVSREALANFFRTVLDFDRSYRFDAGDSLAWTGDLLIVDGEADRYIGPEERGALRALYPRAMVKTMEGAAHAGPLLDAERYAALYRAFLSR